MTRSSRLLLPMIRKAIARLPGAGEPPRIIAVDLTPWPPPVSLGLDAVTVRHWLRAMCKAQLHWRWILLTAPSNHDFFVSLEGFQVRRHCVQAPDQDSRLFLCPRPRSTGFLGRVSKAWRRLLALPRPPRMMPVDTLLRQLQAGLLFCPFGSTNFPDITVPMVALWNDLTHLHYPQFLLPEDLAAAGLAFKEVVCQADKVVCFSPHHGNEIVRLAKVDARRISVIDLNPLERLPHHNSATVAALLEQFNLAPGEYFLTVGDCRETNNHKLLLVAFGMFRERHPPSELKLVFAGTSGAAQATLRRAARSMGLENSVVFAAAERAPTQAALLQGCLAVIMPALEPGPAWLLFHALEFSKPILCSDVAGWPETIRNAALLFNPRNPLEMVTALQRMASDTALGGELIRRSHRQAQVLGGPRDTAGHLLDVFQEVLSSTKRLVNMLKGVYPDGWTHARLQLTCAAAAEPRTLRLTLQSPRWLPWGFQWIRLVKNRHHDGKIWKLKRGRTLVIEQPLPREGGTLEVLIDPAVIPKSLGLNDDARLLGCLCRECTISGPTSKMEIQRDAQHDCSGHALV